MADIGTEGGGRGADEGRQHDVYGDALDAQVVDVLDVGSQPEASQPLLAQEGHLGRLAHGWYFIDIAGVACQHGLAAGTVDNGPLGEQTVEAEPSAQDVAGNRRVEVCLCEGQFIEEVAEFGSVLVGRNLHERVTARAAGVAPDGDLRLRGAHQLDGTLVAVGRHQIGLQMFRQVTLVGLGRVVADTDGDASHLDAVSAVESEVEAQLLSLLPPAEAGDGCGEVDVHLAPLSTGSRQVAIDLGALLGPVVAEVELEVVYGPRTLVLEDQMGLVLVERPRERRRVQVGVTAGGGDAVDAGVPVVGIVYVVLAATRQGEIDDGVSRAPCGEEKDQEGLESFHAYKCALGGRICHLLSCKITKKSVIARPTP